MLLFLFYFSFFQRHWLDITKFHRSTLTTWFCFALTVIKIKNILRNARRKVAFNFIEHVQKRTGPQVNDIADKSKSDRKVLPKSSVRFYIQRLKTISNSKLIFVASNRYYVSRIVFQSICSMTVYFHFTGSVSLDKTWNFKFHDYLMNKIKHNEAHLADVYLLFERKNHLNRATLIIVSFATKFPS